MDNNTLGALGTVKGLSLTLAVLHHGLSCLAQDSIPAKIGTVIQTAKLFEEQITGQSE